MQTLAEQTALVMQRGKLETMKPDAYNTILGGWLAVTGFITRVISLTSMARWPSGLRRRIQDSLIGGTLPII